MDLHFLRMSNLKATCNCTLTRNHFFLQSVNQYFLRIAIWKAPWNHTLERNHFPVKFMDKHFLIIPIWKATCNSTLDKNHLHVNFFFISQCVVHFQPFSDIAVHTKENEKGRICICHICTLFIYRTGIGVNVGNYWLFEILWQTGNL